MVASRHQDVEQTNNLGIDNKSFENVAKVAIFWKDSNKKISFIHKLRAD
jgi:hypothetical protein